MRCLQCGNNFSYDNCENCPQCGAAKEPMIVHNRGVTENWIANYTRSFQRRPNSNIISPGRYVFGVDLPLGSYLLRVISGLGMVKMYRKREKEEERDGFDGEIWARIGLHIDWDGTLEKSPLEYRLHGLHEKEWFTIDYGLNCEISKADTMSFEG